MRFHLLALPNTQTTRAYSLDGFAMCTIRFAQLLKSLGHTVILYASEENEAPCDELVTCITKEEQNIFLGDCPYQYAFFDARYPMWHLANTRAIREIKKRKQPKDFICSLGGESQKPIAEALPDLMFVEYSIGYSGTFSQYRVYESHVWRHMNYGHQKVEEGRFFDDVIPCFFDESEFPYKDKKEDFALYVGRLIPRKGIEIACLAAHAAGVKLKVIGHGDKSLVNHGSEYLGALDINERNEWMSRAFCVFCPTTYIEPFNCVAVEAQLCGTPVISTDFGGFIETVEQWKTGMRCTYLGEFASALKDVRAMNPEYIRKRAVEKYSIHNIKHAYERYFQRLMLLWDKGWDSMTAPVWAQEGGTK